MSVAVLFGPPAHFCAAASHCHQLCVSPLQQFLSRAVVAAVKDVYKTMCSVCVENSSCAKRLQKTGYCKSRVC